MRYEITGVSIDTGMTKPTPSSDGLVGCSLQHFLHPDKGAARIGSSYTVMADGRVFQGQNRIDGWIYCFEWDTFRNYPYHSDPKVKSLRTGSLVEVYEINPDYNGSTEIQISQVQ